MNVEQDPPTLSHIERYELVAEIGRGGMGRVFRAYDEALERTVALKILAPDLAHDPRFVAALRREAISAARLRHPHIALLYEFGQTDDLAFLVMEYVPGDSLRQLLAEGPLPPHRTLAILAQIADALEKAMKDGTTDHHQLQQIVRRTIGRWVGTKLRRKAMIVPVVVVV